MSGITILGAGIAGLTLGQCLRKRGISALILERAPLPSHHTYGLTLRQWAYQPLADVLGEPIRSLIAVDNHQHGSGCLTNSQPQLNGCESFRANRSRLEAILRKGLNIKYNHQLTSMETTEQHQAILKFKTDVPSITLDAQTNLIVGADGVHSELRRFISPSFETTTLPYVVFNGRRNIPRRVFQKFYAPHMNDAYEAQTLVSFQSHPYSGFPSINVLLRIQVNDYNPDGDHVNISYTYSRPSYAASRGFGNDPLHMPNRSKGEATTIPDALFEELELLKEAGVSYPYLHAFDPVSVQNDRLLHWLMRSGMMKLNELEQWAPDSGSCLRGNKNPALNFLLIGDAVHPVPILGGEGANHAIRDGMELAEHIARFGLENMGEFYKQTRRSANGSNEGKSRWDTWRDAVDLSEKVLREMHGIVEG